MFPLMGESKIRGRCLRKVQLWRQIRWFSFCFRMSRVLGTLLKREVQTEFFNIFYASQVDSEKTMWKTNEGRQECLVKVKIWFAVILLNGYCDLFWNIRGWMVYTCSNSNICILINYLNPLYNTNKCGWYILGSQRGLCRAYAINSRALTNVDKQRDFMSLLPWKKQCKWIRWWIR